MQGKTLIISSLFMICLAFSMSVKAQLTYTQTDSLSLHYLNNQNWNELKQLQKQAKTQGISYPNLDYRSALAYYFTGKTRRSAFALESIEHKNPFAPYIKNYRLLSYAAIGMQNEAWAVSRKLDVSNRSKLGVSKYIGIRSLSADGAVRLYSDSALYSPLGMANFSVNTMLGRGYASMCNQYGFVNIRSYFGNIIQHQFYTSLSIPVKYGISIEPAIHFLHYTVKSTDNSYDDYSDQDFAASLRLNWNNAFTELQYTQTWLGLYGNNQWQSELGLKIYPLQNNKLTLHVRTILSADSTYKNLNPMFFADAYGLPVSWLETGIWFHHINQAIFAENNLKILNNSMDLTRYKTGAYLRFYPGKGISPMLYYFFERRRELIQYTPYYTHTLGLSLQYSF